MRLRDLLRPGVGVAAATIALLLVSIPRAGAQSPPAGVKPAPSMTTEETQRAFTDLLGRYFRAYTSKHLDARVAILAEQGDLGEAFRWSKRGRQRARADLLGGDGSAVTRGLTPGEQQAERAAERDVRTLAVKIRRERARKTPDAARIAELQAALLSYSVGEARTWIFAVVAGKDVEGWSVRKAAAVDVKALDLAQAIRKFREATLTKDQSVAGLTLELHTLLVKPVAPALAGKTRLVVIPDGCLWALPFEALQPDGGTFLVEDAAVGYAPSLTALAAAEAAAVKPAVPRTLVAFGQPDIAPADADRLAAVHVAKMAAVAGPLPHDAQDAAALFGTAHSRV